MRTTLDLPEGLVEEAQKILGYKSKTDTIIYSLQELIRRQKIKDLTDRFGKIHLNVDLDKSRRRPRR